MMKRVAKERGLPVVEYSVVSFRASCRIWMRAENSVSRVREAGEPRIVGGHFEGAKLRRVEGGAGIGAHLRSQGNRGARHHRTRVRMRGARQRPSNRGRTLRNSALARVLRLRRQVSSGPSGDRDPGDLSPEQTAEMQRLAVECYRAVECEGMARVDFLLETATNRLYINEINTIPGFTSISMYPKMWEYSGLPMPKLIDRLIELAGTARGQATPAIFKIHEVDVFTILFSCSRRRLPPKIWTAR
jgi:hypothetical protein